MIIYTGSNEEAVIELTDTRGDNQTYQVAKLADNNCWMLNNLKLGSTSGSMLLTPGDTNIASNFTLPQVVTTGALDYDNPGAYGPVSGDTGLEDGAVLQLLQKEVKKRTDAAEMYKKAGDEDRSKAELFESEVIAKYLPQQLSDDELEAIVEDQIAAIKPEGPKDMGRVIGAVKAKVGQQADGARIAQMVKQKLI